MVYYRIRELRLCRTRKAEAKGRTCELKTSAASCFGSALSVRVKLRPKAVLCKLKLKAVYVNLIYTEVSTNGNIVPKTKIKNWPP